jgi:hypothetical protein
VRIEPEQETFEMFVSYDLLERFSDAEITYQELIDESIMSVNGNSVKVSITDLS